MSPSWKRTLVFGALITTVAVVYRVWSEFAGPRFDEGLAKIEADAKSKLPTKVDEWTTLVDLKYEPKKTVYWYVADVNADVNKEAFNPRELERNITNQICANADVARTMREKGFSYEYHYRDKAGTSLATFIVTKCL